MGENDERTVSGGESGSYDGIEDFDSRPADDADASGTDRSITSTQAHGDSDILLAPPEDVEDLVGKPEGDDAEVDESQRAPSRRRLGPGLMLVGLAASMWAAVGIMRCDGAGPEAPTLAVADDEHPAEESTPQPDPAAPEPAVADNERPVAEAAEPIDSAGPDSAAAPQESEDVADAPEISPEPAEPSEWAAGANVPRVIRYTVRHGGSIKNVANLFKIFHHEITALNPGIGLDQQLPPKSAVVVYKAKAEVRSESVGGPSAGSLEGGVPMVEGPGRVLKAIPWKSWGTEKTVALLDAVLRQWAKRTPKPQPILVGNMSARTGGKLPPHSTHQSGRDVDLGYLQKLPKGEELNWREMTNQNLDGSETWALLQLLSESGQIEVVYIDRTIQKLLHEYALSHHLMSRRSLEKWMEYPRPTGTGSPLIQHVRGHVDHLHVRFKCQAGESKCRSRR